MKIHLSDVVVFVEILNLLLVTEALVDVALAVGLVEVVTVIETTIQRNYINLVYVAILWLNKLKIVIRKSKWVTNIPHTRSYQFQEGMYGPKGLSRTFITRFFFFIRKQTPGLDGSHPIALQDICLLHSTFAWFNEP